MGVPTDASRSRASVVATARRSPTVADDAIGSRTDGRMNFIRKVSRSLKRVVLGDDGRDDGDDEHAYDANGCQAKKNASRGRRGERDRERTPVVESAVSSVSGIACGGVQGLGWVKAREVVDEDGDVADGFLVCADDDAGAREGKGGDGRGGEKGGKGGRGDNKGKNGAKKAGSAKRPKT